MGAPRRDAGDAARAAPGARPPVRKAALRSRPRSPASVEARLLALAEADLRRDGPTGVTVVGVAAAAGMTHANVYRYFPSRVALVDAVAGRWLRELEASLAAVAAAPDPADDKLERLILLLAGAQRQALAADPHVFAVHREAVVAARPPGRRHRARLRALFEEVIDEGVTTAAFRVEDRDAAATFLFDIAHRFVHPACIALDAAMPRDLWDARLHTTIRATLRMLRSGLL